MATGREGRPIGQGQLKVMITIRPERPEDITHVRAINEQAFGQASEADIVDTLRQVCPEVISLVAEDQGLLVGHILFTPVVIESGVRRIQGMGLAPMTVMPDRQRQGIGTELVNDGLRVLRDRRFAFVIVLGHPEYYPRFGFERASNHGIRSQWEGSTRRGVLDYGQGQGGLEGRFWGGQVQEGVQLGDVGTEQRVLDGHGGKRPLDAQEPWLTSRA